VWLYAVFVYLPRELCRVKAVRRGWPEWVAGYAVSSEKYSSLVQPRHRLLRCPCAFEGTNCCSDKPGRPAP
jgi:hypothetical protein